MQSSWESYHSISLLIPIRTCECLPFLGWQKSTNFNDLLSNASNFGRNIQNLIFLNYIDTGSSGGGTSSLLATTFIVNLPQLILSIYYVTFNSIFTYLVTELEWASYGTAYKTLRVTDKKGAQRSTHRLQLPYRYSVPLLLSSTLLHWLYSKSTYVGGMLRNGVVPYIIMKAHRYYQEISTTPRNIISGCTRTWQSC